jgi:glycosyltransferase involved in cell wall biosynthesis
MRILVWHGWLLEGTGSNVYTARTVEIWRRQGHDVVVLCQEPHPERLPFLDAWATVGTLDALRPLPAEPAPGRAILVRPDIGDLLPVFVYDEYEGFRVKTFVELTAEELEAYLSANTDAIRRAAEWHRSELAVIGHAVPGPAAARRALGRIPYVAKMHGSDIEYAIRAQRRYVELAEEGLAGAAAITGSSRDVLDRLVEAVPSAPRRMLVVPPGVETDRFTPRDRREALLETADRLEADPALERGRTEEITRATAEALRRRDARDLHRLAARYDQRAPDRDAPGRLRALAEERGPVVGYLGKLIPQKGVDLLLAGLPLVEPRPRALIVGFGTFREWLEALVLALDAGDAGAVRFILDQGAMTAAPTDEEVAAGRGMAPDVAFTGVLDHRYAPEAVAALDVLVVPSVLEEAFGMVALEGTAAGALPLMARHSGLAEIAQALETEVGEPELLSFEPGPGATRRLAGGLTRLLAIPEPHRRELRGALVALVADRWGWERTADGLLEAAHAAQG